MCHRILLTGQNIVTPTPKLLTETFKSPRTTSERAATKIREVWGTRYPRDEPLAGCRPLPRSGQRGPCPRPDSPGYAERARPGSGTGRYPGTRGGPAYSRPDRVAAPEGWRDGGKTDLPPGSPPRRSPQPGGAEASQAGGQRQAPPRGRASSRALPTTPAARGYLACQEPTGGRGQRETR